MDKAAHLLRLKGWMCGGCRTRPGGILVEESIDGFGITQNKFAVSIGMPPRRINEIVHGTRGITSDAAIPLARYIGASREPG